MKDINILRRQKLYLRSKTTTENTIELSVYDEKLYFCKNAQTSLTCSVVTLARFVATVPVSQRIEPRQFRIIAHPTSNQLKACSCARSSTSASSLVFPTLTLVRAILLQAGKAVNNCSFFQIQLGIWHFHPQTLSSFFRNFHWKSQARFRESQCGRIHLD